MLDILHLAITLVNWATKVPFFQRFLLDQMHQNSWLGYTMEMAERCGRRPMMMPVLMSNLFLAVSSHQKLLVGFRKRLIRLPI